MSTGTEPPRLLEQVRTAMRARHYSLRTEQSYLGWIRRFIVFHGKRHPASMGEAEVNAFLTDLAVRGNSATELACWSRAFAVKNENELRSFTDYIFPLLTNGPRDLIEFCNLAKQAAEENGKSRITIEHFKAAEAAYSRDCLDEVEREYGELFPEIADVVQKLFDHPDLRRKGIVDRQSMGAALSDRYLSDDIQLLKKDIKWLGHQTGRGLIDVLFKVGIIGVVSSGSRKERLMS